MRGSPARRSWRLSERRMTPVAPVGPTRLGVVDCGGGAAVSAVAGAVVVSSTVLVVEPSGWVTVVVVVVVSALTRLAASKQRQLRLKRRKTEDLALVFMGVSSGCAMPQLDRTDPSRPRFSTNKSLKHQGTPNRLPSSPADLNGYGHELRLDFEFSHRLC